MYQSLPFADSRQRQDARPRRRTGRYVLTGEKDYYTTSPADQRELHIVLGYGRR